MIAALELEAQRERNAPSFKSKIIFETICTTLIFTSMFIMPIIWINLFTFNQFELAGIHPDILDMNIGADVKLSQLPHGQDDVELFSSESWNDWFAKKEVSLIPGVKDPYVVTLCGQEQHFVCLKSFNRYRYGENGIMKCPYCRGFSSQDNKRHKVVP